MKRSIRRTLPPQARRGCVLAAVWITGLVLGCILGMRTNEIYRYLMRSAAQSAVSIIGLLATAGVPFLFVYFSVYISRPKLIYLICFLKACSYSLTGMMILSVYGSAGWLVRLLLQFTESGAMILLCWFACGHLEGSREKLGTDTVICSVLLLCLGCMDHCYVSPFLAMLV